jgi:hypothetical protein
MRFANLDIRHFYSKNKISIRSLLRLYTVEELLTCERDNSLIGTVLCKVDVNSNLAGIQDTHIPSYYRESSDVTSCPSRMAGNSPIGLAGT